MRITSKFVITLFVSLACFSCNNSSKIKITLNAGAGVYTDFSASKTFLVDRGTRLSDIPHECPTTSDFYVYLQDEEEKTAKYWTYEDGNVYQNSPINHNMTLYAQYYSSLEEQKILAYQSILTIYNKYIEQIDDDEFKNFLTNEFSYFENATEKSNSPYKLIALNYVFSYLVDASYTLFTTKSMDSVIKASNFVHHSLDLIDNASDDLRCCRPYVLMVNSSLYSFASKDIEFAYTTKYIDLYSKTIEKLSPDFAHFYGEISILFRALTKVTTNLEAMKQKYFNLYEKTMNALIHTTEISQVRLIIEAVVGIASLPMVTPNLDVVDDMIDEFTQLVKEITGASV